MSKQAHAEYLRHLHTEQALQRERAAFHVQGIGFRWERLGGRLIATLRGHDPPDTSGKDSLQGMGAATRAVASAFPHAVILKGNRDQEGRWWFVTWLDAPEAEAQRREEAHPHLDPRPTGDTDDWRCPHDGATCRPRSSRLHGVTPKPCDLLECRRATEGKNLIPRHEGYPLPGFVYPAKVKP